MERQERIRRAAAAGIACVLLLRLPAIPQAAAFLADPRTISAIFYLETGYITDNRKVPLPGRESPPPETAEKQHPDPISFGEDAVSVSNTSGLTEIDFGELLQSPLSWHLRGDDPTVLIYHTHTTESYEKEDSYEEISPYHTLDPRYNMIAVGEELKKVLEEGGIRVIHDTTVYDSVYGASYDASLEGVRKIMEEHPGICLLLDLHRDAAEENGVQIFSAAEVRGELSARLMAVCGSDGGGNFHPYWRENLAVALKLQNLLGRISGEICRPVSLSPSRFNQQYYKGSLLIEVGTAGNTLHQAKVAVRLLGEAILQLADGSQ